MKTDFSALDGPGNHLITGVSLGDTIASESFATQFILDLARALSVSPCQFYVKSVVAGDVYHTWSIENVIVTFRFFPADATVIKELTRQIQFPDSELYKGNVTSATDDLFGLVAVNWDASLKLTYSMSVIGEGDVKTDTDGTVYLDQGSERFCKDPVNEGTAICEFEVSMDGLWASTRKRQNRAFIITNLSTPLAPLRHSSFRMSPKPLASPRRRSRFSL